MENSITQRFISNLSKKLFELLKEGKYESVRVILMEIEKSGDDHTRRVIEALNDYDERVVDAICREEVYHELFERLYETV